jgi:HAD superfamily phosphatase (TIGR01668 family)
MKPPKPDHKIGCITELTPEWLEKNSISAVLMDVDGTLLPKSEDEVSSKVMRWAADLKKHGIKLAIVSNNSRKRIKPIAVKLGVPYVHRALKPSSLGIKHAMEELDLLPQNTLFVGDEEDDIIAAHCAEVMSVKVKTKKGD